MFGPGIKRTAATIAIVVLGWLLFMPHAATATGRAETPALTGNQVGVVFGEQYDPDLGLYYLRARFYSPRSGRFWTADTWEGLQERPTSQHKFIYTEAKPVNFVDPSGHFMGGVGASLANISIRAGLRAAIGGAVRAGDAAIDGRNVYEEFKSGAKMGAAFGALTMFKALRPVLAVIGTAMGGYATGSAISEGKWGLAGYRGVMTAAGVAGYCYFATPRGHLQIQAGTPGSRGVLYAGAYDPSSKTLYIGRGGHFDGMKGAGGNPQPGSHPGVSVFETSTKVIWANDSLSMPKALTTQQIGTIQSVLRACLKIQER